METTILIIFIVIGILMLFGANKLAILVGAISVATCFGYRYWIGGEELRVVIVDALFCLAVLPIGWLAAKQFQQLVDEPKNRQP